ncbi:hypothetical protein [Haloflavibacter putidus]|uniref:Uncharacterized protein n=1 Tax=Haloflavibacter putidus TaxID=2576776 RepID=A0A507ZN48_9FLAO|nr:hypothetical protein [Haloflavibacter putidus]TQD38709.1 hypothetical protein FKR84_08660 [Haloflavibacter putidus]
MKTSKAITVGTTILLTNLIIYAVIVEKGDINTIGLIFVIFLIPAIVLGFLNGFFLDLANKRQKMIEKRIWSLIPILLLTILAIADFRLLHADMSFLGVLGLVAFGITNLIWNLKLNNKTDENTLHNKNQ